MRTTGRDFGFPAPGTPSAFQPEPPVSLRPPSAPPFDSASSSRELCASSRVLRPATCPSRLEQSCDQPIGRRAPPLGFLFPHRGVNWRRPPLRRESRPRGQVPFTLETCCGYRYDLARKSDSLRRSFKGRSERTRRRRTAAFCGNNVPISG